jgi:hypothetical protein
VTLDWLNKITPRALAFWFMDDGSNTGVIATNSFSLEEIELIKNWFLSKYNIETTIQKQISEKGENQYLIYVLKKSKADFANLIREYMIPSMYYKIENWI